MVADGIPQHPSLMIQAQTAFIVIALLYIALPITAWSILHKRHERVSVNLWCAGSFLMGIGFILVGLRGSIPDWLSFVVANPVSFLAYPIRAFALRYELKLDNHGRYVGVSLLAWLLVSGAYLAAYAISHIDAPRLLVSLLVHLAGAVWLVTLAWGLYRKTGFRSAAMLAIAYGVFVTSVAIRAVSVTQQWEHARALSNTADVLVTFIAAAVAALYGNLGYIGIALEASHARELTKNTELARELERRMQTEARAAEQRALLDERERLLAERDEMIGIMAHEVRQPLNNASAALQSATHALFDTTAQRQDSAMRLQRASSVLAAVTAALDNTLADAVLLAQQPQPVTPHDVDLDLLVELAMGDMASAERTRVRYERLSDARTASMNAGLVRLALRNVVANALAYSPPGSAVIVRVRDLEEPLAIVFEVSDAGPGISPDLLPRIFERGVRGPASNGRPGHGLGLHIVHRVLQMHGGTASVVSNTPQGLVMQLVVPQQS